MSHAPPAPAARVCVLTPEGRGAVAVLRLWGPDALRVADLAFRPARGPSLGLTPPGRPRLGRAGAGRGDEVVAIVVGGDPPEVEIQCHGGSAAVAMVVGALEAAGAERRQPVAWVRHAAPSAVAAEAEVDLARAPTVRTAEILLEQRQGALEGEAARLIEALASEPGEALRGVDDLLRRWEIGRRLVSGWRVALAGRPNVGKSRLLNALAGYERAIVDPTPGTTRDVVTVSAAFEGWPVELADTAGLRASDDPIEASGVALARARQREADLVLVVLDRSEPLVEADRAVLAGHPGALVVANKADLAAAWPPWDPAIVLVSAERGDGVEELGRAIARRIVPDPPPAGGGVPFRPGQARWLAEARERLSAGDAEGAEAALRGLLARLPER